MIKYFHMTTPINFAGVSFQPLYSSPGLYQFSFTDPEHETTGRFEFFCDDVEDFSDTIQMLRFLSGFPNTFSNRTLFSCSLIKSSCPTC